MLSAIVMLAKLLLDKAQNMNLKIIWTIRTYLKNYEGTADFRNLVFLACDALACPPSHKCEMKPKPTCVKTIFSSDDVEQAIRQMKE